MIKKIQELEAIARQLEPNEKDRNELAQKVFDHTSDFLSSLDNSNAFFQNPVPGTQEGIDEQATPIDKLLRFLKSHVEEDGINAASGGHMGYVPGGGLYPSALGDYLAAISNKYAGIYFPAPGAARMENMLIRWMNDLMGFPSDV